MGGYAPRLTEENFQTRRPWLGPVAAAVCWFVGGLALSRLLFEAAFPAGFLLGRLSGAVGLGAVVAALGAGGAIALGNKGYSARLPLLVAFLPLLINVVWLVDPVVDPARGRFLFAAGLWLSAVLLAWAALGDDDRRWQRLGPLLVVIGLLPVYWATTSQAVDAADTFEFQVVAPQLGIAHPTGYPLYLLLGKLFALLPAGTVAWRLNLASAIYGVLAAAVVFRLGLELWRRPLPDCAPMRSTSVRASSRCRAGRIASGWCALSGRSDEQMENAAVDEQQTTGALPDERGHFGPYGGRFVAETLMAPLQALTEAYLHYRQDPEFLAELEADRRDYVGRPSPIYHAERLSREIGGAQILLKREDLNHTGAHKINNTIGQALLAKRMGKPRIIAETGAGQHGVASATVAARLGLECVVYMGAVDVQRQAINVFRMKLLGATVVPVTSGSKTLKDALNEALRDWVTNVDDTFYIIGTVAGPHPYPMMVRDFNAIAGIEARAQMLERFGRLPDALVACVGGGSNAIGLFHPFIEDRQVAIYGVEAAGRGLASGEHAASLCAGRPGVLHGNRTYLLSDPQGQIMETHSVSAGLDYPGVGPEHAWLKDTGRASYVGITDDEALAAFHRLCRCEGIIPALESAHAVAYGMKLAAELPRDAMVLVNLSGRGDKDVQTVAGLEGLSL